MLDSLHRRPRGVGLSALLSRLTGGRVPGPPPPPDLSTVRGELILEALRDYVPAEYEERAGAPTRALLERLDEADVATVLASRDAETRETWERAAAWVREPLTLILAAHHEVTPVLEKTGLRSDAPPHDVHSMGRGPMAAGGDFWLADLIAEASVRCGVTFAPGSRVLDFGCSSGRHLRVLQAWRPDVRWLGCDPNQRAIEWAGAHLPGIDFFTSPQDPPLDLEPGSLDVVFAVSVWSHFGPSAAMRWLEEMHRLLRPDGLLVLTTQGVGSLAYYLRGGWIDDRYAVRAVEDLLATGHHYREAFGAEGDWGVKSPQWGMAYMTLDWLAARALPRWTIELFEPVRIDQNQDLVVLRRGDG